MLFGDYESFLEAQFAITYINIDEVNKTLYSFGLNYDQGIGIAYIGDMINEAKKADLPYKSMLYSGYQHPSMENLGIHFVDILESRENFSRLELINPEYYLKDSARMRFAGIDMGLDFLVVSSVAQFRAFDTFSKKAAKALGRDIDNTPTLFLPQVALLALGEKDDKILGLNYHNVKL